MHRTCLNCCCYLGVAKFHIPFYCTLIVIVHQHHTTSSMSMQSPPRSLFGICERTLNSEPASYNFNLLVADCIVPPPTPAPNTTPEFGSCTPNMDVLKFELCMSKASDVSLSSPIEVEMRQLHREVDRQLVVTARIIHYRKINKSHVIVFDERTKEVCIRSAHVVLTWIDDEMLRAVFIATIETRMTDANKYIIYCKHKKRWLLCDLTLPHLSSRLDKSEFTLNMQVE